MDEPRSVINLEDPVGKAVGRTQPPRDPLNPEHSSIQRSIDFQKAFNCPGHPKGVFRFHSHEEADQAWVEARRNSRRHAGR